MLKCGLLGQKLSHSFSPKIHKLLGDYSYTLFEKEPKELECFLKNGDFNGINVTIPYKKTVIPYLNSVSKTALEIGSVNTVIKNNDGSLYGDNTDVYGFLELVRYSKIDLKNKKVLVLGSGGASVAIVYALNTLGALPVVISRTGENNYNNLHLNSDAKIIVNTTPVGMYPNNGVSPININNFKKLECVYDIIYNPYYTALLLEARKNGIPNFNGMHMLVAQAKKSAELFTHSKTALKSTEEIVKILNKDTKNIVLIGMPGSGKSAVSKVLSSVLNRELIDTDNLILENTGFTPAEIIKNKGEKVFRSIEQEMVALAGKQSGKIISTGGGAVLTPENYPALKQNGTIFWLCRDINKLATYDRPLSNNKNLNDLFIARKPFYDDFCDFTVSNNSTIKAAADEIIKLFGENL